MKKIIIVVLLISTSINFVSAQDWKNYFQFGVGTGYLMDADINDTPFVQFEYGRTYKWLDLTAALEYARDHDKYENISDIYLSLTLKAKVDLVRVFKDDLRHSFKLGTGFGIGTIDFNNWYYSPNESNFYTLLPFMASYEYKITEKMWLGLFFNDYISDTFFGLNYLGINVRYDF